MATISSQSTVADVAHTGLKYTTLAVSAITAFGAVNAIAGLSKTKELGSFKKMFLPVGSLLVAVSAWSWAMTQPVTLVPVTKGA